jgi:hypothetical protein
VSLFVLIEASARTLAPRPVAERKHAILSRLAAFFGSKALDPIGYREQD